MVRWLGTVEPSERQGNGRSSQTSGHSKATPMHAFEVNLLRTIAILVVPVVAVFFGYHIDNSPKPLVVSDVTGSTTASAKGAAVTPPAPVVDPLPTLVADMNAAIATNPALSASATLIDLTTGKEYDAGNSTQYYEAASTSKLVAVFDYIHQVELGKTTLARSIQGQTAQDIIMRMIVYSDNDAWDKLNGYLKFKGEQAYLDSIGVAGHMTPSNIQFSTPAMAKMLQLLHQGKLMTTEHQTMIYGYMSHTTVKNLIQAVLPADALVYHKYGQIEGVLHDASIVEYQGHQFVLVVYTNNAAGTSGMYTKQVDLIHAVTTAAFNDVIKS